MMLHVYDRTTMARALSTDLAPELRTLLINRRASLITPNYDLTDDTEYIVVEPGDTEADLIRQVGFSPLIEPIDGTRFRQAGFHPFWDYLGKEGRFYEMIVSFGSAFAYVLIIPDKPGVPGDLIALCRHYV